MLTGVVDQNPPHRPRSYREELIALAPLRSVLIHQLEVCLVDQRGRRECMAGRLAAKLAMSNPVELVVHQWKQPIEGRGITSTPGQEEASDIVITGHELWSLAGFWVGDAICEMSKMGVVEQDPCVAS